MNKIITISRQFGSGGHSIGKMLAAKLEIPFYDNEIIALAAEKSGYDKDFFSDPEKNAGNSFLYSVVRGMQYQYRTATPWSLEETVYNTQSEIIRSIAEKGPCVIIGRCADYILEDNPNLVKVFIYADDEFRRERIIRVRNIEPSKAAETIKIKDKRRANYYNYHADAKWGDATNYDICIKSSFTGIEGAVDMLYGFLSKEN